MPTKAVCPSCQLIYFSEVASQPCPRCRAVPDPAGAEAPIDVPPNVPGAPSFQLRLDLPAEGEGLAAGLRFLGALLAVKAVAGLYAGYEVSQAGLSASASGAALLGPDILTALVAGALLFGGGWALWAARGWAVLGVVADLALYFTGQAAWCEGRLRPLLQVGFWIVTGITLAAGPGPLRGAFATFLIVAQAIGMFLVGRAYGTIEPAALAVLESDVPPYSLELPAEARWHRRSHAFVADLDGPAQAALVRADRARIAVYAEPVGPVRNIVFMEDIAKHKAPMLGLYSVRGSGPIRLNAMIFQVYRTIDFEDEAGYVGLFIEEGTFYRVDVVAPRARFDAIGDELRDTVKSFQAHR